jgi:hypothetical protein
MLACRGRFQRENRRKRSKKLRRRERGWEKKNKRQSGKRGGEEADRVDGKA